jgi:hypothetical protein
VVDGLGEQRGHGGVRSGRLERRGRGMWRKVGEGQWRRRGGGQGAFCAFVW